MARQGAQQWIVSGEIHLHDMDVLRQCISERCTDQRAGCIAPAVAHGEPARGSQPQRTTLWGKSGRQPASCGEDARDAQCAVRPAIAHHANAAKVETVPHDQRGGGRSTGIACNPGPVPAGGIGPPKRLEWREATVRARFLD